MAAKLHTAHLYQPPAQGTAFVAQHAAVGYRHTIMAKGGFDTASFTLQLSPAAAELAFSNYLGCVVRVIVDNPDEPVWEGYIDRMTWRAGGVAITRGFDNMMNRVNVTYYNADSAAGTKTEQTAVTNSAASQALYGVKEGSIDAGVHYDNADKTHKTALRDLRKNIYAYPQVSVAASEGGDGVLEIECKGLQYYVWDWSNYKLAESDPSNATSDLWIAFARAIGETAYASAIMVPANATLVYDTGTIVGGASWLRDIDTTVTAAQISYASENGQTHLQFLQSIVEAGDGVNRYVFGISSPDPNDGLRRVYYRQADTTIRYTAYALSDTGRLRDVYGRVVPPWLVRPDAGVRINDILTGWDESGDDPRIGYIESIEYDAEAGTVAWQTGDDITLEGAMQRKKPLKAYGANNPFAATPRQMV
jgi:hypothetical protein